MENVKATSAGEDAATLVATTIREQITSGQLKPGDRILSERRLADHYELGLHPIRLALAQLRKEGVLETRSRSGIYVAELDSAIAPDTTPPQKEPARTESFHLHDLDTTRETVLRFVVCGWRILNIPIWRRICDRFNRLEPQIKIEPLFPDSLETYSQMSRTSDGFITTPQAFTDIVPLNRVVSFPTEKLEAVGVADRYIKNSLIAPGIAGGVPITATLMIGMLNQKLLGAELTGKLQQAPTWLDVFQLLNDWSIEHPQIPALNLHSKRPINIGELARMAGADTLPPETGRLDFSSPEIREVLKAATTLYQQAPRWSGRPALAAASVSFTCNYETAFEKHPDYIPWVPPHGENGYFLEGLNIGVVHPDTLHPEVMSRFLLYLASKDAQQELASSWGEHAISNLIPDLFAAYPPATREVCNQVHAHAMNVQGRAGGTSYQQTVDAFSFENRALKPLSESLLRGDIDLDTFCERIEQYGLKQNTLTPA